MRTAAPRSLTATALAAVTAAALLLGPTAAHAAPVFDDPNTRIAAVTLTNGGGNGGCTDSDEVQTSLDGVPVRENGPATTISGSASGTVTAPAPDQGDVLRSASAFSATASVSSANGSVKSIDLSGQGAQTVTSTRPTSACTVLLLLATRLDAAFTVSQPGFLTVDATSRGVQEGGFEIRSSDQGGLDYASSFGAGLADRRQVKIYLPVGHYSAVAEFGLDADPASRPLTRSGSTSIHATFTTPGSLTQPAVGKGNAYVTLPTTRSCGAHSLSTTLTATPRRAKKVKSVTFLLDGRPVSAVRAPAAGQAMAVPVPDDRAAELTAVVVLHPRKHRRLHKKTFSVTAGYEACTI
jgi:hypothetical protein